jgi:hypothetical protein
MTQGLSHSVREQYACNFEQICDMHTVMSYGLNTFLKLKCHFVNNC